MIKLTIDPESIERFRSVGNGFETFGDVSIPGILDRSFPPGAFSIAAMSPWIQVYYYECQRNELLMSNAVFATGKSATEIRALAAQSPLPFDMFVLELMQGHDQARAHHPEAPPARSASHARGDRCRAEGRR